MSEEFVGHCILAPDGVYLLHKYRDEKELERFVVKNSIQIFGARSVYLDMKQKVESKAKARVTDGLLLDLNNQRSPRFWIVEIELSVHDPYKNVEPQIRGFLRALKDEETLGIIRNTIYEELRKDRAKLKLVKNSSGEEDAHYFIDRVLRTNAGVIIIIDTETPQLREIVEELTTSNEVRLIEFRTYKWREKLLHSFVPLTALEGEKVKPPLTIRMWEELVKWTNPEMRTLSEELIKQIEATFSVVKHRPRYRWYYFYSSEDMQRSSLFAVLLLGRKKIHIRICVNSQAFDDPRQITKEYKGWFFKEKEHSEMGFDIANSKDLTYAMTLIRQSYERGK